VLHTDRAGLPDNVANTIKNVRKRPATLEDVFFRLTGRTLEE
jgi:hypothetical protein